MHSRLPNIFYHIGARLIKIGTKGNSAIPIPEIKSETIYDPIFMTQGQ